MMIETRTTSWYYLSGLGLLAALSAAACGTGKSQACDGKTSALCATGGSPSISDTTGGYHSTSSTVLKIEGGFIRDLSRPNPSVTNSVDAGAEDDGMPVILHGVNRSGTEYQCVKGAGIFDGPDTEASVQAIASWKVNAVRVPLNETCWLNINDVPQYDSGAVYKNAIQNYVGLLHKYDIYPILELHWVAPGEALATGQLPMPDRDHALDFWRDVALTFKDDLGVIFELYNEPYPNDNSDDDAAWQCWRDGCMTEIATYVQNDAGRYVRVVTGSYPSAGFQELVDVVRETEGVNTAASHAILLGGVQYSNRLTQWAKYRPTDSANNLGAAWHIYNFNGCAGTTCFDGVPATLHATTAVVVTEFGEDDCNGTIVTDWMDWFDAHQMGHLAWTWDTWGACRPSSDKSPNPWPLISNHDGTPNPGFGQAVHDHFVAIAQ